MTLKLFDQPYYIEINQARWDAVMAIISQFPDIRDCMDIGCGPGWFSEKLSGIGLRVHGIDGRQDLVEEARKRVPNASFSTVDVTSSEATASLSAVDLVFCYGLLYHLENPFAAVRNLCRLTSKYLMVETQVAPGENAGFVLVSEGRNETQGLNYYAVIPSRKALVKMLYVAGFKFVYRYTGAVDHPDFIDASNRLHRREIFVASKISPLNVRDAVNEQEPATPKIDYSI